MNLRPLRVPFLASSSKNIYRAGLYNDLLIFGREPKKSYRSSL